MQHIAAYGSQVAKVACCCIHVRGDVGEQNQVYACAAGLPPPPPPPPLYCILARQECNDDVVALTSTKA